MFLSKKLANILFGKHGKLHGHLNRSESFTFPAKDEGDKCRTITYAGDDGLILYFIKRIERLEEEVKLMKSSSAKSGSLPSKNK